MRKPQDIASSKSLLGFIVFFIKKQWLKIALIQLLWLAWPIDQTIFPLLFGKIIDGFTNYIGDREYAWGCVSEAAGLRDRGGLRHEQGAGG